jgi:DNA-binding CsgD family transcriptional regulator
VPIQDPAEPVVVGRAGEQAALRAAVDAARDGLGAALVVHGGAGIGKTLLLGDAEVEASDFVLLRVAGVEAETTLGYAALHRLTVPLLGQVPSLPGAQRRAFESTLGMHETAADRFLVSLAALTLITDLAVERPVLCVVDDAQWIDRESLEVLSFIGRRLHADRVVLLMAFRDPVAGAADLPEGLATLQIDPLSDSDARELLATVSDGTVDPRVAARVVSETGGVPLAILELAQGLSDEQLAGRESVPEMLSVATRLDRHFQAQVRALSSEAQLLLLIAASEPTGAPDVLGRAASSLGISSDASDAVLESNLVVLVPTVSFRHPLIRSAVYNGSTIGERRRVHLALAEATDASTHPDRRAWHRASAAAGPDEGVAEELSRCAEIARSRGGYAAEAALRTRAAELTPDAHRRGKRLLEAAQAHSTGGDQKTASRLLESASSLVSGPRDEAERARLAASLHSLSLPSAVPASLLDAARALQPVDAGGARRIHFEAVAATLVSFQLTTATSQQEVARAALAAPRPATEADSVIDLLCEGFATRIAVGYAEAFPLVRRAYDALGSEPIEQIASESWALLFGFLPFELWEERGTYALLKRLEQSDRATGSLGALRVRLSGLGHHEMWRGRFDRSAERFAEVLEISVAMGGDASAWRLNTAELEAWQGNDETTRAMAEVLLGPVMQSIGAGSLVNIGRMGLIVLDVAQGRYRDAFDNAWQLFELDPISIGNHVLPEIVEAGARCGEPDRAARALRRLDERATLASTPWALGLLARSRALLGVGDETEALFADATAHLEQTDLAFEQARTALLLGEWLRRRKRPAEARRPLRDAVDRFEAMGAHAFEERAARELRAAGEHVGKRSTRNAQGLTPQESQIAYLAASGATNAEIAAQLFLSSATIDYHLRKVFRKLEISSRRELRDRKALLVDA